MPVALQEKKTKTKPSKQPAVLNFCLPPQWNNMPFPTIQNQRSLRSPIVLLSLEEKLGISNIPSTCIAFDKDWPYLSYF